MRNLSQQSMALITTAIVLAMATYHVTALAADDGELLQYKSIVSAIDDCQVELEAKKGNPLSRFIGGVVRTIVPGGGVVDQLAAKDEREDACIRNRLAGLRAEVEREAERLVSRLDGLCAANQCTSEEWRLVCQQNLPEDAPEIVCARKGGGTYANPRNKPASVQQPRAPLLKASNPPLLAAGDDKGAGWGQVCDDLGQCVWLPDVH